MVERQKRVEILRLTPSFSHFTKQELEMLAPVFKERWLSDGEALFRQGDRGDYLAVIASGELAVEVSREGGEEETTVGYVGESETVGAMACLDPAPRSATVRADGEATALILTRTMLDSLKANATELFSKVVRGLARRLSQMLDETNELLSRLLESKDTPRQLDRPVRQEMLGEVSQGKPMLQRVRLSDDGVFAQLDDNEREVLRSATEARRYGGQRVICMEGEPAASAYLVVEGQVDVIKEVEGKNYRLATVGPGSFLGQRALLLEGQRSATLRTRRSGATILVLSRLRFESLLEAASPLAVGFQESVTVAGIRQLRQANAMITYLDSRQTLDRGFAARPSSQKVVQQFRRSDGSDYDIEEIIDGDVDEQDDLETLASAYLETALEDWDLSPSELNNIRVERGAGQMSAAEKKMREKNK